jgi:hypothetical protein
MREKYPLSSFLTKLIFPKYEEGKKVTGDMENLPKTYRDTSPRSYLSSQFCSSGRELNRKAWYGFSGEENGYERSA